MAQITMPQRRGGEGLSKLSSILNIANTMQSLGKSGISSKAQNENPNLETATAATSGLSNITTNPGIQKIASGGTLAAGIATGNPLGIAAGAANIANQHQQETMKPYNPMESRLNNTGRSTMDNFQILKKAQDELNQSTPEIRMQYGPALNQTIYNAYRQYRSEGRIG